ncbi:MAG: DNA translocase FtsK 4TM domain-containing protein [Deltaproteobacteria bacterium]|nr:DNA translocase FtsK 4TM domain-containing protein [Deltaproteobacteria bacterium]
MGKANRRTGKRESEGRGGTGMGRDIAAVLLTAAGLLAGLALLTFQSLDGQLIARDLPPASNLVGPFGHHVAAALYKVLGFAALVLPFALVTGGWRLFRGEARRVTLVASAAYLVLILSVATLCHLALASRGLASFPAGGAVGAFLCRRATGLLGGVGAALAVGAVAVVALIVAVDLKVQAVAGLFWRASRALGGWAALRTREAVVRHREAVQELRAEEAARRAAEAAMVEARSPEEEAEALAVAGELSEERDRLGLGDDPAWVADLAAARQEEPEPRRRRRKGEAAEREPEIVAPPVVAPSAVEAGPAQPEAAAAAPAAEPLPPEKPQIVLSDAMRERGRKRKEKKEAPAFAFMQSGEVFQLPATELLDQREQPGKTELDEQGLRRTAEIIVSTLREHDIDGSIRHIRPGPVVTLYEFSPEAGVKLSRIENLDKELTMALSATRIRIIAPIPGKGVVGIEVPNKDRAVVTLREVLETETYRHAGGMLPLALGKNIEGIPYCVDLQRMPHLLIAGTTGSGKSVGLNTMILSLLYRQTPDQVRMIMVDPKMTELSAYEDIPHLLLPVVTDPSKASRALQWAVDEMERRTQILADTGSKDLRSYNGKVEKLRAEGRGFGEEDLPPPKRLLVVDVAAGETEEQVRAASDGAPADAAPLEASAPYEDPSAPPPVDPVAALDEPRKLPQKLPWIVVVIDELADLMMTAPREVEISLARLAQKARATGIHLIVATQRPSTDVVTGMIKNNFPARISFRLQSRHDSSTVINGPGAESLLGDGDMLVMTATQPITRVQGAFVSEEELHRVVSFLKDQGKPVYDESILKARDAGEGGSRDLDEEDPVYDQALDLVSRMEEVSVSKLQREMRLGYNKAAKIVERMEREGVVGPANGVKPRQVLVRPIGETPVQPNV